MNNRHIVVGACAVLAVAILAVSCAADEDTSGCLGAGRDAVSHDVIAPAAAGVLPATAAPRPPARPAAPAPRPAAPARPARPAAKDVPKTPVTKAPARPARSTAPQPAASHHGGSRSRGGGWDIDFNFGGGC